ncbi:unnamed protein product, partial [Ilex paraguariensis]
HLENLDLTDNNLYGDIPRSLGSLNWLTSLHLHNNRFSGKLPSSLHQLTELRILDLGKNAFSGVIPPWIGENLHNLEFLSLQSNEFYGDIPLQLCWLSALHLLNLAHNSITGNIPHCFSNFTAMVVDHNADEYDQTMGTELQFTTTTPFLTSIDLSNNDMGGEIPEELMHLWGLRNLNLAGNHLIGRIPKKIGSLKQLESVDLSRNELSGPIPPGLSDLNYLNHLNLLFNNLSGQIPTGHQLQTLDDQSIYRGIDELCGAPLLKSCSDGKQSVSYEHIEDEGGEGFDFFWFYAGIGPGFSVGFVGVCCTLHFKRSWRYTYFRLVDNVYNRILLVSALAAARLQRKFHKGELGG